MFIYYSITPVEEESILSSEQGSNESNTTTPWKFPRIVFPWTPKKTASSGNEGSGGSAGSGGSGSGGSVEVNRTKPLVNYTLYVDSVPSNLTIFVNYSIDRQVSEIKDIAPYSLKIDGDSTVCVLVEYPGGSGTLKWEIDGRDCIAKECYSPWAGCEVLMDSDHTIIVRWTSTG